MGICCSLNELLEDTGGQEKQKKDRTPEAKSMPGMCERLKINYDTAIAGRMSAAASAPPPAALPAAAEKPVPAPSPAPAASDPEAGAA